MKEYLFLIGMKDRRTGDKINLRVWGENVVAATNKITSALFGYHGEYVWTGSGPLHETNEVISRDVRGQPPTPSVRQAERK